ncbi:Katanin p80 WD40 repeat-containing subunit B1 [Hordeum vulgare]|nr:Katanin p80 WD40 repeat-containing subunit B1 [Hordeum vulgare]
MCIGADDEDMATQTQDLSDAIVLSDSQFSASYVEDSQALLDQNMPPDSYVVVVSSDASIFVPVVLVESIPISAAATAPMAKKDGRGNNMKW